MVSKTITVNVDAEVEEKFRRTAKAVHGRKKGYLGKALTDAMKVWTKEKEQTDSVAATLRLLDEGIDMGITRYKSRGELHERQ
jgi:predicted transcriptional regulator